MTSVSQWVQSHREILMVIAAVGIFIAVRSINFQWWTAFSSDQADFSLHALDIFRNHDVTLVGVGISFAVNGRMLFQGSIIYYFSLLFLLLGNWDPLRSSYFFMIFCGLMTVPLYYGVKMLAGRKVAWFLVVFYLFFPFYVNHTRYLWNANYQFAFIPLVLFLMGLYRSTRRSVVLVGLGVVLGMIFQFHYQLVLVLVGLAIYYLFFDKLGLKRFAILAAGFIIGFLPMIAYELHSHFYNSQTILLFLTQKNQAATQNTNSLFAIHYILSASLFGFLILGYFLRRYLTTKVLIFITILLGGYMFITAVQRPTHAEGMKEGWNYPSEYKVNQIILSQNLSNYNVVNLPSDTLAKVQKYLLRIEGRTIDEENYKTNQYLFVISRDDRYTENPAYEVNTFQPSIVLNDWQINDQHRLYLLKRL